VEDIPAFDAIKILPEMIEANAERLLTSNAKNNAALTFEGRPDNLEQTQPDGVRLRLFHQLHRNETAGPHYCCPGARILGAARLRSHVDRRRPKAT
jgi:hypothetical protein